MTSDVGGRIGTLVGADLPINPSHWNKWMDVRENVLVNALFENCVFIKTTKRTGGDTLTSNFRTGS